MARVLYGGTRKTYGHVAGTQAIVGRLPEHGGHNLICEALFYPKPLLCFPIAWHSEEFLNVSHVHALGMAITRFRTRRRCSKISRRNWRNIARIFRAILSMERRRWWRESAI